MAGYATKGSYRGEISENAQRGCSPGNQWPGISDTGERFVGATGEDEPECGRDQCNGDETERHRRDMRTPYGKAGGCLGGCGHRDLVSLPCTSNDRRGSDNAEKQHNTEYHEGRARR